MDKVTSIHGGKIETSKNREPIEALVEALKDTLAEAESGELRELVLVSGYKNELTGAYFGGDGRYAMNVYAELTHIWLKYREDCIDIDSTHEPE